MGSASPCSAQEITFQLHSLFPRWFFFCQKSGTLLLRKGAHFSSAKHCHSRPPFPDGSATGKEGTCESPQLGNQSWAPLGVDDVCAEQICIFSGQSPDPTNPGHFSQERNLEFSLSLFFFPECDLQSFQEKEWGLSNLHPPNSHARAAKGVFTQM